MTLSDANVNDITKHLEIIKKEADQIGNYSGEYNHKSAILKSVIELQKILGVKDNE